jgi:hypothetical protein
MDCTYIGKNVLEFTLGNLPEVICRDMEMHLAGCRDCRTLVQEVQLFQAAIEKEKALSPGEFFYTRLEQQIKNVLRGERAALKPVFGWALSSLMIFFLMASLSGGILAGRWADKSRVNSGFNTQQNLVLGNDYFPNDSAQYELENMLLTDNQ